MNIAVIGSAGQLGSDLVQFITQSKNDRVYPFTHQDLDCTNLSDVKNALQHLWPNLDAVINCAAYVRVDDAEDNPRDAFLVNAIGAKNIADACNMLDIACVYISTDYVFDGAKTTPYSEDDQPRPLSTYGASKTSGEELTRIACEKHYIVRCSGLFGLAGASGKGGNFITTMLHLANEGREIRVVADQIFSPTSTHDLAKKILWLITTRQYGVSHITSKGECTWHELASSVFELTGNNNKPIPISTQEYGAKAKRPLYSVLGHEALQQLSADDLPPWQEAVHDYLLRRGDIR